MIWTSSLGSLRLLAAPAVVAAAQVGDGGDGALRPYIHVLLAYAVVWILILLWVWWIARKLGSLTDERRNTERGFAGEAEGP